VSERTLVLVKPDGVSRGLVGEVIKRLEAKGLQLVAAELRTLDRETAETHYAEHAERPFFGELVEFITSAPLMALVVEGERATEAFRMLAGATDPVKATPGTIRGDFALAVGQNVVHGSDSPDSAAREIALFFPHLAG
jgi:nucleoside-diphosphate kinase